MGSEKLKSSRNGASSLWFSISKVCKKLDRLGTSTSADFRQVKEGEVERYLDWDLNHNPLVVMYQLILRQGRKDIAIGGYLLLGSRAMVSFGKSTRPFLKWGTRKPSLDGWRSCRLINKKMRN